MIYNFDCVEIDDELHLFQIKKGTLGTFEIDNIKKTSICYEEASFKGKTKPFTHQFIGGSSFFTAMEPKLYIGIKVITKTDDVLAIYISDVPVLYNSNLFLNDNKIAKKILRKFNRIITNKTDLQI